MANHKSAIKRARQNNIKRRRNRAVRTRVKSVVKEMRQAASEHPNESLQAQFTAAQSTIDKAAKKGVLHKRTAGRKIARLAKLAQSIQA